VERDKPTWETGDSEQENNAHSLVTRLPRKTVYLVNDTTSVFQNQLTTEYCAVNTSDSSHCQHDATTGRCTTNYVFSRKYATENETRSSMVINNYILIAKYSVAHPSEFFNAQRQPITVKITLLHSRFPFQTKKQTSYNNHQ